MREKVQKILADIESLKERNGADCRLPENVFYLNDEDILCLERKDGESRYPYEMDGLRQWGLVHRQRSCAYALHNRARPRNFGIA